LPIGREAITDQMVPLATLNIAMRPKAFIHLFKSAENSELVTPPPVPPDFP
jgi:hypothetical protein